MSKVLGIFLVISVPFKTNTPDWRLAQKSGVNINGDISELQDANNNYVEYYKSHANNHPKDANLSITADIVNLVIDGGTKIYKFVKGISDDQKKLWIDLIEAQRIPTSTKAGELSRWKSSQGHCF